MVLELWFQLHSETGGYQDETAPGAGFVEFVECKDKVFHLSVRVLENDSKAYCILGVFCVVVLLDS
jgi:hypothetical protein